MSNDDIEEEIELLLAEEPLGSNDVMELPDDSVETPAPRPRREPSIQITREADDEFDRTRPQPKRTSNEGGFDLERGLAAWLWGPAGISQVDARRERRASAGKRSQAEQLAARRDAREQQKHDLEMEVMRPLKAEQARTSIEEKKLKLEAGRQSIDPTSNYSQTMRSTIAERFLTEAGIVGARDPAAAAQLEKVARNIAENDKISAQQLIDVAKQFGPIGSRALQAAHSAAMESIAGANLGIARGRLDLDAEKEERRGARDFEVSVKHPQEKLNREISDLTAALEGMQEAGRLKGKVNTGFAMSALSKLGEQFDLTSDERNDLNAIVARVFNKETKSLAGAAVSAQEWARISPQIPQTSDDDSVFLAKLRRAIAETQRILDARKREYQMRSDGSTVDQSVTAKRNAPLGERPSSATPPGGAPSPEDAKALKYYNDPKNRGTPAHEAVGRRLRKKGLI